MELDEIMSELAQLGSEQSKKVLLKHGAREPFFGVKIADLKKKFVKKIRKNYELSLKLYDTGNSDAMYLAGLISEPEKMTREQLTHWVENAYWYLLSEYTVAGVTAESKFGWELATEWIENKSEMICGAGWAALSSLVAIKRNEELDLDYLIKLLDQVEKKIHLSQNRVKYTMNGFVIALASYVEPLTNAASETAHRIGKVQVEMGGTSCKVPFAPEYIRKIGDKGKIGIKKKRAIC